MNSYLEPYTDSEMVYEALALYAAKRRAYAESMTQKGYLNSDGSVPTSAEILYAATTADQADRLTVYAKEKVESPIVLLQ